MNTWSVAGTLAELDRLDVQQFPLWDKYHLLDYLQERVGLFVHEKDSFDAKDLSKQLVRAIEDRCFFFLGVLCQIRI